MISALNRANQNRMNGANILNIAYGYQVERNDDQLVGLIGAALQKFEASGVPGSHLVDAFPWRKSELRIFQVFINELLTMASASRLLTILVPWYRLQSGRCPDA
jgi:hypothetical protein